MKNWCNAKLVNGILTFVLVALALSAKPHTQDQGPPEPHHNELPPGWFCTHEGMIKDGKQTDDHPCSCLRMSHDPQCCDDPSMITETPDCMSYCEKKTCACPVTCEYKDDGMDHKGQ